MSELGRLLVTERDAKGLALDEVEAITRIRQKYLEALESGAFDDLPRGAVARGFLRTYAGFLGVDVDLALRLYAKESGDVSSNVLIAEPGKPRLVDYRPLEVELMDTRPTYAWVRWLLALLIVVAIGGLSWFAWSRDLGGVVLQSFRPSPTATFTNTPTETPWIVTATARPTATPTQVLPTPTSDLLPLPTPTVPATPTSTPRPMPTPEIVTRIVLGIVVQERSWVTLVLDGETVEHSLLEAGYSRVWEAQDSLSIRVGNAIGVVLTLNGAQLDTLGERNQVVDLSWSVNQGEVVENIDGSVAAPVSGALTPTPAG